MFPIPTARIMSSRISTIKSATNASASILQKISSPRPANSASSMKPSGQSSHPTPANRTHLQQRGLQPMTFENDGVALVMVIVICGIIVLGLIFTAAHRILHRLRDWWACKKAERRAAAAVRKTEEVSPDSPSVSMSRMDVIDITPSVPARAHLHPPISFSAIRRAALFHRPSSGLSTIPSQAEEGSRSIPSVPSMTMEDDWQRISNASSTPPRQSSRLSFGQAIPETTHSHCSLETSFDLYTLHNQSVSFNPYELFDPYNIDKEEQQKRPVPAL